MEKRRENSKWTATVFFINTANHTKLRPKIKHTDCLGEIDKAFQKDVQIIFHHNIPENLFFKFFFLGPLRLWAICILLNCQIMSIVKYLF